MCERERGRQAERGEDAARVRGRGRGRRRAPICSSSLSIAPPHSAGQRQPGSTRRCPRLTPQPDLPLPLCVSISHLVVCAVSSAHQHRNTLPIADDDDAGAVPIVDRGRQPLRAHELLLRVRTGIQNCAGSTATTRALPGPWPRASGRRWPPPTNVQAGDERQTRCRCSRWSLSWSTQCSSVAALGFPAWPGGSPRGTCWPLDGRRTVCIRNSYMDL